MSLSPIERKILPFLELPIDEIMSHSGLDEVSIQRALEYLSNKKIVNLTTKEKEIIDLGENGKKYQKSGLPEKQLLKLLAENPKISLQEAASKASLSDNEFKVALGTLKGKALIELKEGNIILKASQDEITKKTLEETFLESLPRNNKNLQPEEELAIQNLKKRKEIIEIKKVKEKTIEITDLGKQIQSEKLNENLIEQLTTEMLKTGGYIKKQFRRYDIESQVPSISSSAGKSHFINQTAKYGRKIWTDLGFKEMTGSYVQTSFWNFDALFQPQDHPVRDMHDTFFLKIKGKLPNKEIVEAVKKAHETGVDGSKGWRYKWDEEEAKKVVLRTHTTCLSAQTLAKLTPEDLPAKFFALGKNFRNETIDWSHGFEFNQTEGIVIDENVTFRDLLGYLKEFYKKMGFEKVRFSPAYFPYTEPSVEVNVFHPEKKVWLELGGAGIFRPEVTEPLLGKNIKVLAWGQGFDRILTDYYKIKDLREIADNNIKQLREKKFWIK